MQVDCRKQSASEAETTSQLTGSETTRALPQRKIFFRRRCLVFTFEVGRDWKLSHNLPSLDSWGWLLVAQRSVTSGEFPCMQFVNDLATLHLNQTRRAKLWRESWLLLLSWEIPDFASFASAAVARAEERRVRSRVTSAFAGVAWTFAVSYQYNSQNTGKVVLTTSILWLACFQLAVG